MVWAAPVKARHRLLYKCSLLSLTVGVVYGMRDFVDLLKATPFFKGDDVGDVVVPIDKVFCGRIGKFGKLIQRRSFLFPFPLFLLESF